MATLIFTLIVILVMSVFGEARLRSNSHQRRLAEHNHTFIGDSLTFLTDIVSHHIKSPTKSAQSANHNINFMSPEEIESHKSQPAPKKKSPSISVETSAAAHTPKRTPKPHVDESRHITFLTEDEKQKHKGGSHKPNKKKPPTPSEKPTSHLHMVTTGGISMTTAESLGHTSSWVSPSPGTVVTPENLQEVLKCPNQSRCVTPALQLATKMRVYLCRHPTRHGVRFYYLTREGFLLHPNVELVNYRDIGSADYIVYLPGSAPWHLTECNQTQYASKLVVMDEFDGPVPLFNPARTVEEYAARYGGADVPWYNMYFKRSYVRRSEGMFTVYPHLKQRDVFPLTYSVAEAYLPHAFNFHREIEILCTLRGHARMPTRLRVQQWVGQYATEKNVSNVITSQVTTASRTTVSAKYFQQMYNAKIIVTVNPSAWEGDFRLWEALGSGALVFVDYLFVPHMFPLIHEEHVVFFDNNNATDLFTKLDYYRSHWEEGRRIAHNGYLHALLHHRTVNMIDYVLTTAHTKRLTIAGHGAEMPKYLYTGQYLHQETVIQASAIKKCQRPGIYETGSLDSEEDVVRLRC